MPLAVKFRVTVGNSSDERQLVFGTLDTEPLNDYDDKLNLGSELAVSYEKVREHKKASEFKRR